MTIIKSVTPFFHGLNHARRDLLLTARLMVAESKVRAYETALQAIADSGSELAAQALSAALDIHADVDTVDPVEVDGETLPFERPYFFNSFMDDPNAEPSFLAEFK